MTCIADTTKRDRLLALGCTLDGYSSRDDADAALEEAMLEGNMPLMHWFVVVVTAAGTAPVELLCTVDPDPPSRPDCDVFAFGDDSEMARAQFTDHGGVHDDAAEDSDADADVLLSPAYSPPPDGHADSADVDPIAAAGTPATLVGEIPRQPLFTPPVSRPMTLTEQQLRRLCTCGRWMRPHLPLCCSAHHPQGSQRCPLTLPMMPTPCMTSPSACMPSPRPYPDPYDQSEA